MLHGSPWEFSEEATRNVAYMAGVMSTWTAGCWTPRGIGGRLVSDDIGDATSVQQFCARVQLATSSLLTNRQRNLMLASAKHMWENCRPVEFDGKRYGVLLQEADPGCIRLWHSEVKPQADALVSSDLEGFGNGTVLLPYGGSAVFRPGIGGSSLFRNSGSMAFVKGFNREIRDGFEASLYDCCISLLVSIMLSTPLLHNSLS